MATYRVISPAFIGGTYYAPNSKRDTYSVPKAFPKNKPFPEWLSPDRIDTSAPKAKAGTADVEADTTDAEDIATASFIGKSSTVETL